MESDLPLVSIGIPYYKAERFILETLESVKQQTYKNIELILVNDCSPDNCRSIVDNWLYSNRDRFTNIIHISNNENRGVAFSSKILQDASSGIYFNKLDADDIILPIKVTEQVKFLEANPGISLVYSNTLLVDSNGNELHFDYFTKQKFSSVRNNIGPSGNVFYELLKEDFIPTSSVLVKKKALDAVGGYDENLYIEDWDMWLRIAKEYHVQFMDGYFSKYRLHPESMMQKKESLIKVYASLNRALLKHLKISTKFDKIIAEHIFTYTIGMYRYGVIDLDLLKINLLLNKNIKSLGYYLLGFFNIRLNQKA